MSFFLVILHNFLKVRNLKKINELCSCPVIRERGSVGRGVGGDALIIFHFPCVFLVIKLSANDGCHTIIKS